MPDETVLLGGFSHETNTFAKGTTDRPLFQKRREYFGDEISEKLRGTNTQDGGVIDVAEDEGVDLRYTVSASATPSGVVAADAHEFYCGEIINAVEEHVDDLDGVMLCLHGAMVPEGMADGEGPLIAKIRDIVGEAIPISVTLDLHGNITDEMVAEADSLIAYESYPHVDTGDTGRIGMRTLVRMMRGEIDPVMHIERPPVLAMGPKQNTRDGPMSEVMMKARVCEEREDIVKVNVLPGFHQSDVPGMSWSVPVVADGDLGAAREVSRELAEYIWDRHEDFVGNYPEPAEAVTEAERLTADLNEDSGFVLMADVGDNPGGGGATDGTTVLREIIGQSLTNVGFAIIKDPAVVDQCVRVGVGARAVVDLGGKTDDFHGDPIEDLDVYVKAITDGEFVNTGSMETGSENHLGRAVHVQCGTDDGVSVIVTENRMQPLDAEIWRHMGIQPERLDVLVVKSTNHYRADYEPMCSTNIPINSPGLVAMDPRKFEFTRINRPIFPLDEMDDEDYPDW